MNAAASDAKRFPSANSMKATTSVTASRMAPMLSRCPSPDRCRSASRKVYARAVNAMWRCSPGYEVRRVGRDESSGLAVPYAMHVGDVRAVAAEQAVVAEDPQVARLGDRDRWRGLGARVVVPYMHSVLAPGEVATDGPVPHAVSEPRSVRHSA